MSSIGYHIIECKVPCNFCFGLKDRAHFADIRKEGVGEGAVDLIRGLYTSASGMLVESLRADVTANNLANVNTVAFKQERTAVAAFPEMLLHRLEGRQPAGAPAIGPLGTGAAIDEASADWTSGPLQHTGRSLDVALVESGFFVVESGEGTVAYTRDGSLNVAAEGWLVDAMGNRVLGAAGPIQLATSDEPVGSVAITDDGGVVVDGDRIGELLRVDFAEPRALQRLGGNLWQATEWSGEAEPVAAQVRGESLERSNVNIVGEMVTMIEVQRAYEANQRVIRAHDETLEKAVNELGAVR